MTIAALVLAAGMSRRMGHRHKLLIAGPDGAPMLGAVVDRVLASSARPVIVVLGHQAAATCSALGERDVAIVEAADFADGLSASLRSGLGALPTTATAVLICLGDMPLVSTALIDRILGTYRPGSIVAPRFQGEIGNPILWDRAYFPAMAALQGDRGARVLLEPYAQHVIFVEADDDAVLRDFDTPESLAGWEDALNCP